MVYHYSNVLWQMVIISHYTQVCSQRSSQDHEASTIGPKAPSCGGDPFLRHMQGTRHPSQGANLEETWLISRKLYMEGLCCHICVVI